MSGIDIDAIIAGLNVPPADEDYSPPEPAPEHDAPPWEPAEERGDPGGGERDLLRLSIQANTRARVDGATFILDTPAEVVPVWGRGEEVLWAEGEPLLINGPTGVGKTTIAQQLVLARLGMRGEVLGFPVAVDGRPVLYIAADRPSQAARSMARMVTEADRPDLARGLVVWKGPLPHDVVKKPELLAVLAASMGAGTVVVDSLKDVAFKLTEDEGGSGVNRALQALVAEGVEVAALHHQRKAQAGGGKPKALADVYGSTWITAGCGSVVVLWGEAGDAIVELSHLKQPVDTVGPLKLVHDHHRGHTTVVDRVDLATVVDTARNGITALEVAKALFNTTSPEANEVQRARRKLDALVRAGLARRTESEKGGSGGSKPALYHSTRCMEVGP